MEDWVEHEFQGLSLGDKRVNKKAKKIINTLSRQPRASIPQAFNTAYEVKDCYEFFHNGKVIAEKILAPHKKATIERIKNESVILLPQDTSALNFSTKLNIKDLGHIGGLQRNKGIFLHPLLGITPSRVNLGIVDAKIYVRKKKQTILTDHQKYALPIEEKEIFRWIESYRVGCEVARECPETKVIVIADREGDFAELFEEVDISKEQGNPYADIIVRSYHDRLLDCPEGNKLREKLKKACPLGEIEFVIPAAKNRPERTVKQIVKSSSVTFKKRSLRKGAKYPKVTVNAVMAFEENPPDGVEPLIWVFLTTLPVNTFDKATTIIRYYLVRWEIEIYFKVLKSGCEVEERSLENTESLSSLISIFLIIAWRVMYAMKLGRECPEMCAEIIFSSSEWKSVYKVINKGAKLPDKPPSLGDFIIMIARLGGYLNRKNDPPPGPKAMWIGISRMSDFAIAWDIFGID
jgi:hypothetical protein